MGLREDEREVWKQPKCPLIDEWIKDVVHIYDGILLSHKNEKMPFAATWMDLEDIMLSEITQTEKDKYCMISLVCGI